MILLAFANSTTLVTQGQDFSFKPPLATSKSAGSVTRPSSGQVSQPPCTVMPDEIFGRQAPKVKAAGLLRWPFSPSHGYLFNPAFATETSLIDPLPHQRIAVYEHMLAAPRLRFLLADDAGAGKTIMAGLYIREMLTRQLIRRVIIVPPAGLIGNWESELRSESDLS